MKSILLLTVFTLSFVLNHAFAGNDASVNVLSNSGSKTTLNVHLDGINSEKKIAGDGQSYDLISCGNYTSLGETGQASLPVIMKFVQIPNNKQVHITVLSSSSISKSNFELLPYQTPPLRNSISKQSFVKDKAYYSSASFMPEQIVQLKEIAVISGVRIAVITINPVQYNPSTNEIRIYNEITFELGYSGFSDNNNPSSPAKISGFFNNTLSKTIINYEPDLASVISPSMLVICADGLFNGAGQYANWKNRQGIKTSLYKKSELGFGSTPTAENVKAFLQAEYNGSNRPDYVVLIGDAAGSNTMPWFTVGSDKTDHPFSCLDGSDLLPDIVLSRISVQTDAELVTEVNRLMQYEISPFMGQTDWFKRALVCFSADGIDPINGQVARSVFMDEGGFTNVDMVSSNQGSMITGYKNPGISWVWFIGHGAPDRWAIPSWHMSNMPNLTYGTKSPNIIAINCANNDLDWGNSFGEEYMKRSTSNAPSNYFGFTENCAFYTTDTLGRAMLYAYFRHDLCNMGLMMNYGKITAYQYFSGNQTVQETNNQAMLLGDPSQISWSDIPKNLDVVYSVEVGNSSLINVKYTTSNINGALIGVSQSGQLKASGYTNSNGDFIIAAGVLNNGLPVDVVVSGKNLKTWDGSFGLTGVTGNTLIPESFALHQNYPNPFNPITNIKYDIAKAGFVSLKIYDVLGKEAATLINGEVIAGSYEYEFDASGLPSGVYFYRLVTDGFKDVKKMSLIK
ncbi:MAG: T9SS type A sorting domain-containing protein [Ignavibacteria bacterium]|nr:T9SS type A sorting domain-containing protein [Ignavibacteria bacterium]